MSLVARCWAYLFHQCTIESGVELVRSDHEAGMVREGIALAYVDVHGELLVYGADGCEPALAEIFPRPARHDESGEWVIETDVPHEAFEVLTATRGGAAPWCRGIVFRLEDVP